MPGTSEPTSSAMLILGDQLDRGYLETAGFDPDRDNVIMIESASESGSPPSHIQRTVMFLSAMRHFADELRNRGIRVRYTSLSEPRADGAIKGELIASLKEIKPERLHFIRPGDRRVLDDIKEACEDTGTTLEPHEDPHFFSSISDFEEWASGRKELTMEYFYREQRKNHCILMDGSKPVGGSWNYDKENRKSFKRAPSPPPLPSCKPDKVTRAVIKEVQEHLPDLPGRIDGFNWPVTREKALECLKEFITQRLPHFGDHQDAMWTGQHTLYHAVISPAMNIKLLNPREIIDRAVEAYELGHAPLNAVEGFVRQILGWREFMRGIYWTQPTSYNRHNALRHYGDLPGFYWDAQTDMNCMKHAITSVLELAYSHHISRLKSPATSR